MALPDGRVREAELHLDEAFRIRRTNGSANAAGIHSLQLAWLRFDQGRLGELAPLAGPRVGLASGLPRLALARVVV